MSSSAKVISIIGAGWYGCHLALSFLERGYCVRVYEKNNQPFFEASGINQNRLHLGFHYPRCSKTRNQSRRGYRLFSNRYKSIVKNLDMCIYAVPSSGSLIDYSTYSAIMKSSNLYFEEVTDALPFSLIGIEGAIDCEEALIDFNAAKSFFAEKLDKVINYNTPISFSDCIQMSTSNQLVLDCTWNKIVPSDNYFYEVALMFRYDHVHRINIGLTLVDGDLFSIYPYDDLSSSVSHVKYTPIKRFDCPLDAYSFLNENRSNSFLPVQEKIENFIKSFFPRFNKYYINPRPLISIKTKTKSNFTASRATYIEKNSTNFYSVHAGKIDTIFDTEHLVLELLEG
jgi:hypothetical protein